MKNIETKWLYDFLTLGACRHFSQAAEECNLSRPVSSRWIKALKSAIEVLLSDRTTSPLQLTEEGKLFHSQARGLLRQLERNLDELSGHNLLGVPNIRIVATHSLSLTMLPRLVHPMPAWGKELVYYVEVIDVVQTVNTLREGKSDFIISFRDEDSMQSPFYGLKVFESELHPVCAVDAQGKALLDIYQPQVPILNYTSTSCMGRLVNRRLVEVGSISARTLFMSSMSELLENMALDGHDIAWLLAWTIVNGLRDKRPACLNTPELTVPIQAYIYRMDTRLNKTAEHFWRVLYNHMPEDLVMFT